MRLISRSFVPAETQAGGRNTRRLGTAISVLRIDGGEIPLDSPVLGSGWHAPEAGLRWTDGSGEIACAGACLVEVEVAMTGTYCESTGHREAA